MIWSGRCETVDMELLPISTVCVSTSNAEGKAVYNAETAVDRLTSSTRRRLEPMLWLGQSSSVLIAEYALPPRQAHDVIGQVLGSASYLQETLLSDYGRVLRACLADRAGCALHLLSLLCIRYQPYCELRRKRKKGLRVAITSAIQIGQR
ncbi:hypothetical protein LZ31DRAFT_218182 [Colletotrichum somersetense]|nr:hypothetical protein LZ31DRAFT_218182 [Colletotrichum somersetense]